ncbi:hypothetical protein EYC80_008426 [Monilinia laxa]|uniref:Rieske domain-containing protein n=1 Tax=Monilinia laxa TaxID=61186 RepID=A0A5N6JQ95_MONLA|nr:hypothetical protein EYC80_008426 [Monilinia laxa]
MAQEYKLKDLNTLDLQPGEKKEVEVEGIEGGKVLLCNVGGKVTAVGHKCTHYGAPLVKGVLTADGRITCPWHGACFNATNGDIENAPALDALPAFELSEKNENQILRLPAELDQKRTKLSKALIDDPSKIALRDEAWFKDGSIANVNDTVTSIDFAGKKLSTKSGSSYPYTKLVLASGGTPKSLPLPGFKELGNIFLLRNIHHVKEIVAAIGQKNKKIVIIGSSFIGMEVANATAKDNDVTVVGMESAPLERIMGAEVGKIFQKALEGNGVKFHMEAGVEKAIPSKSDSSKVGGVQLKDGTTLEADLVILGTGVGPATGYLKDNKSVELQKDGSLKTDENFLVSGLKDVYAIGDIATYPYHGPGGEGSLTRIEHWNVAQNSGRSVATHINDPSASPKSFIPIFWSALGSQLRYCGNTPNGWDDLVLQGEPENAKFVAYYFKGETVVAVGTMQFDPIMSQASELMRIGKMPSKSELKKGLDSLGLKL